jgi:ParB-like nuclease domain
MDSTPPHTDAPIGAAPLLPIATVAGALGSMDVLTSPPDYDALRKEMRRAIEAREKLEIVPVFKRATHISAKATGSETQYKKEKNTKSHAASREIALRVDCLRGLWLKDLEEKRLRYMGRPAKGEKIGTKPDPKLITLDDLGLDGDLGRVESQNLQLLAEMPPEEFEALVADPTAPRPRVGNLSRGERRTLLLSAIRVDERAQPRAALKDRVVDEYAEAMQRDVRFPPVVVFEDPEKMIWLADGFHRVAAALKLKRKTIECELHSGGLRDAILFACGANSKHGLPRTRDDKHRAVTRMLDDEEWKGWNDSEIARRCKVSDHLVAQIRKQLEPVTSNSRSEPRIYRTKYGTTATMRTSNIGRSRRSALKPAESAETDLPLPAPIPETDAAPQAPRVKPSSRLDPIIIRLEAIRRELDGLLLAELLSDGRRQRFGEVRDQVGSGLREIIHLAVAERDERTALVPEAEERETIAEVTESVEPIST